MKEELQKIFDMAVRAYLPPLDESNRLPVIGIAFANANYPKEVERILRETSGKFKIHISLGETLLNLKVGKALGDEQLFDVALNFEDREYQLFKSQIDHKNQGAFVVGTIHDGQFMIVSENPSSFTPYQVETFEFL
ncbi:hypothetical protein RYH73_25665 [Olivibacter sp. CPCC 100613]|uniref:hypothetical protein n=1 Tax=Olivibacter sp. CPCC 100613 TaxID=3079931 RepID=UPI002FF70BAF